MLNRIATKAFSTTAQRALQFLEPINVTDLVSANGSDGERWLQSVEVGCERIEKADPRITSAKIQGALAHMSSKDKSDPHKVVTIAILTVKGNRVGTAHFHLDGSFKFFPSRYGKDGGFAENLRNAGITVEEGGQ
ncbi:conserved hypothetical protein [Microsporum canis CBS 113480]|uniref:Uncharacterized protein n=1 Tax=Arthroderma otae (strain ATCC MYA-4605 / CBS 113480) TaxID=554155 RepID=C5FXE8_ARTOC|nr:conserved hypothetical protein [Microsporum canis CBS 113480]EEQ34988.1 conserved hypothetical protein [Microsporum canis CBS 113480]